MSYSADPSLGFDSLQPLLNDLVRIRMLEPTSKLRPLEFLEKYIGIKHARKSYYKVAPSV